MEVGPYEEREGEGGFFGCGEKPELPVEVVLAVLGLLSGSDLVRAEAVCRGWRTFLSAASPLGSALWRKAHEAEFGGPMPTGPAAREGDDVGGGTGNRQRKQRVHARKRGDWRLFYRHSLCTLHRLSGGQWRQWLARDPDDQAPLADAVVVRVQGLLRWLLSCGHRAAFARLVDPPVAHGLIGRLVRLVRTLVQGWRPEAAEEQQRGGERVVPLAWAVKSRSVELVRALVLDLGVTIERPAHFFLSPPGSWGGSAFRAVLASSPAIAGQMVRAWLESPATQPDTLAALFHATCEAEEVELAGEVLARCGEFKADLFNSHNQRHHTALVEACERRRLKTIEFLLREMPAGHDCSLAFLLAVTGCPPAVVAAMLDRGARAHQRTAHRHDHFYPIHRACQRREGAVEVVELLLARGANMNEVVASGTPLHQACVVAEPSVALVQLLLDRGALPTATTGRQGWTPMRRLLERAPRSAHASAQKLAVARLLAERGGHLGAKNSEPMHELLGWLRCNDRRRWRRRSKSDWLDRDEWVLAHVDFLRGHGLVLPPPTDAWFVDRVAHSTPRIIDHLARLGFAMTPQYPVSSLAGLLGQIPAQPRLRANLGALVRAGLDPTHALRCVCPGDLDSVDLLLAHGADIAAVLPVLPTSVFPHHARPQRFAEVVAPWLRGLHARGLDFRGIGEEVVVRWVQRLALPGQHQEAYSLVEDLRRF